MSVCLYVHHRHLRIAARVAAAGGRARCHGLLYIQCGCVMQFGAKRCAQRTRWGCTSHDGRAKPAWAARTGPAGAPHSVRRSRVPTSTYLKHSSQLWTTTAIFYSYLKITVKSVKSWNRTTTRLCVMLRTVGQQMFSTEAVGACLESTLGMLPRCPTYLHYYLAPR